MNPLRLALTARLAEGLGVLGHVDVEAPRLPDGSDEFLLSVHSRAYVDAVEAASANPADADTSFGLGTEDDPAFVGMHDVSALIAAGTLRAVQAVHTGEYEHAVDDKGRVILPAKFRDRFEAGAFLTKVLDGCLAVYTPEEFALVAREVQERARRGGVARNVARTFAAGTTEVVPDRQGRIAIPQTLRSFAGLTDRVMVTGQFNRLEIWDAETWRTYEAAQEQAFAEQEEVALTA